MCIFCKIVNKEIPSSTIYEDDLVLAFLDLSQVTKGHTLIVPKAHYTNILDCDEEILAHMAKVAKTLSNRLITRLDAKGINVLSNANEEAGQSVMHFHIHLIPRYDENDAIDIKFNESEKQDLNSLVDILK